MIPTLVTRPFAPPRPVEPLPDYGFFGPDSVSWKVWGYPTSLLLGFSRAVAIEELDPLLVASVTHSGQVRQRTPLRFDRTMQYFANVIYGDARSVLASSEILMKIHSRSIGTDQVTGRTFDANDPESQLWIHLTAWHSILYTYEIFGPGQLSPQDEDRFWQECALAAEFQTIDPATVPRTSAGVEAYFESYRPNLVASDIAQDMFRFLINLQTSSLPPEVPSAIRLPVNALTSRAVIATLPRWMRDLAGTPQSRATDLATVAVLKPALAALTASPTIMLRMLHTMSQRTYPILAPVITGVEPVNPRVYTVAEARAEFGFPRTPQQLYAEQLAARAAGGAPLPYGALHHDPVENFSAVGEQSA